jgi:uncharacterized protein YndB with AHSA1/START domain
MSPNRHGSAVVTMPSDTEYLVTRSFDAPAKLVFEAMTTPELIKRWWGFEGTEWLVCEHDVRPGGAWRHQTRDEGQAMTFFGEYREVSPPHRLVYTEDYEGPGKDAGDFGGVEAPVITVTFEEVDGVTTMKLLAQHASKELRDAIIESGMETGMQVSYDRLDDLVRATSA